MKDVKVAMLLYTQGLEYDDRIRKEILTLQKNFPNVKFTIFAVVPQNKEKSGITEYGVPYFIPYLKSRDKYASGTKTLLKAWDFYRTVKPRLKEFDVIWCADIETFLFPLLLRKTTPLVWDQHEIPARFLSNNIMKRVFRYMEGKCNIMYHANQPRIDYLKRIGAITDGSNHIALRNYPESRDSDIPQEDSLFDSFKQWENGRKCVYIQGISSKDRKAYESLAAVLRHPELCAVVVGSVDSDSIKRINEDFEKALIDSRLYFTGKIPQKMTKLYIKECIFSLVFYATNTPNNIYCEPNRMFQSIMMGIPVIVGNNPSMKDVVDEYNVGISLDNDGSDINSINNAIIHILDNYEMYKDNVITNRDNLCWNHQDNLLCSTFEHYALDSIN